jgi:chitinase
MMKKTIPIVAGLALLLSGCATVHERPVSDRKVVMAYFMGGEVSADMPVELLTHICYAFANVHEDGTVHLESDSDAVNLDRLTALKAGNPRLKVLLSIGGWGWSKHFSNAALTAVSRKGFIDSAVTIMMRHRLDGLDIDWEYPGQRGDGNVFRPEDKKNFTLLLKELRERLDALPGGSKLQLTVATGAFKLYLVKTEPKKFVKYVDYVSIMTYDFSGFGGRFTGHHTNLRHSPADTHNGQSGVNGVEDHIAAGIPPAKIVLGCAFYGKGWDGGVEGGGTGLFAPVDNTTSKAFGASFAQLADNYINKNGFVRYWDEASQAPYLWNAEKRTFVTYDDEESVAAKCAYVRRRGLAGAMFWEYHGDKDNRLLKTIHGVLAAAGDD